MIKSKIKKSQAESPAKVLSLAPRRVSARVIFPTWRLLLLSSLVVAFQAMGSEETLVGPAFSKIELTLESGVRTEVAGPLYYKQEQEGLRIWAVPPLLAYTERPDIEAEQFQFLYPLLTYNRYGGQYRFQFFQLLNWAGGETSQETNRDRFTIFPIYFQQRSSDPSQNYTAVVPFYGHLKNRLFRDEIFFVMFPAYSKTRKADIVTYNYLFPVFHLRTGNGLRGWQAWPLAGVEHKDVTTKTNIFGDIEEIGGWRKLFVLWPFFFNQHTGVGTTNTVWQQGVIPAYSLMRSPKRDSTTLLWPFFSHVNERERGYREWDAPWPLVEFARGPGKHASRVWPFYSHAYNSNAVDNFYMWPIYKYNRVHADPLDRTRARIFFFLYSDTTEKNTQTGKFNERIDFWPLFTHFRDFNGNSRLQILAPLEPLLPGRSKVEIEYSPVWSIWRSENNPNTGAASQSLLWNLYRREVRPGLKRVSFLFGLFQLRKDAQGRHLRLFYFPVGR